MADGAQRLDGRWTATQKGKSMVHLIHLISVRNGMTRYQYIIVPPQHAREGRHVGEYRTVADAYHAAEGKGAPVVYLHHPMDFPISMSGPDDTKRLAWVREAEEPDDDLA
jgi:hypothetical protein